MNCSAVNLDKMDILRVLKGARPLITVHNAAYVPPNFNPNYRQNHVPTIKMLDRNNANFYSGHYLPSYFFKPDDPDLDRYKRWQIWTEMPECGLKTGQARCGIHEDKLGDLNEEFFHAVPSMGYPVCGRRPKLISCAKMREPLVPFRNYVPYDNRGYAGAKSVMHWDHQMHVLHDVPCNPHMHPRQTLNNLDYHKSNTPINAVSLRSRF